MQASGLRFRVKGYGFGFSFFATPLLTGFRFRVKGLGFGFPVFETPLLTGFRVWGLGFLVKAVSCNACPGSGHGGSNRK